MAKNLLSKPPLQAPIMDGAGNISRAWAVWFRDVYARIGFKKSNAIDDNKKETDQTIADNKKETDQSIDDIDTYLEGIDDDLLLIGATIGDIIDAVNANDITMNNHIGAESAHGSNGSVVGFNDTATDAIVGLVKRMQIVADAVDATSSSVVVSSPNATAAPAAYDQAQVQTIVTLANETKDDVNTLVTNLNTVVTEVNAIVTQLNDLIAKSKTAGQMNVW